jgi:3-oxosteroid 1-dehydrogenase
MILNNAPDSWDMAADVVAVGSGIGGLSAAITAHEHGASALVLERSDQVGGVTALSMGEVWVAGNPHAAALGIEDSPESGFRYLKRLAMGYGDEAAIANMTLHAREALAWFEDKIDLRIGVIKGCPDYYYGLSNDSVAEGRMLEVEPFPAATLGEWQERTRVSPQMPYGLTHGDIEAGGGVSAVLDWDYEKMGGRLMRDERCLGSGLAAYFVKGVVDRNIPMMTGVNVTGLIGDGARIVGVRAEHGGRVLHIKANRGVLLAVSSYERNPEYNKQLSQQLDVESMVLPEVDGAAFRLAGPFGAKVARVPDITSLGVQVPGEEDEGGRPLWRSVLQPIGLPHTIVVNRAGKRFGNEAFYRSFYYTIDLIDGASQSHPNFPCWAITDSQARAKYAFASALPGAEVPEGLGVKADTLEELARLIGVDPQGLVATVAKFNPAAAEGKDPEFHRGEQVWSFWMSGDKKQKPNPVLGPLDQGPFYAYPLKRLGGSAIPAAGLLADEHSRALGWDDQPIPGLYVAGNSQARMETGAMMQSGISNARGMMHGWLAGRHASGHASDLLAREGAALMGSA